MVPVGREAYSSSEETGGTFSHSRLSNSKSIVWIDSELPITGNMQAHLSEMLRRDSPTVTPHSSWTLGCHH